MTLYQAFSILIVLAALFAYINHRFIKLPSAIGLMLLAIIVSVCLIGIGIIHPQTLQHVTTLVRSFNFSELLLGSMLSFMLFAGAMQIHLEDLKKERLAILVFSTVSVILSTFIIGGAIYGILSALEIPVNFIYCLLFGAIISPTDPIAVLGILREANISKSLEMKLAGESLFNDGIAVVIFLTILQVAEQPGNFHFADIIILFMREALGGTLLGITAGFLGNRLMCTIDNYKVEILITLAIVMGTYSLASLIDVSGPLAIVASGIIIGNRTLKHAPAKTSAQYINMFWELIDEILNAVLFVLIGLEILVVHFHLVYMLVGFITILIAILTRYMSLRIPGRIIAYSEKISHKTILLLTWGGLRGGLSIAMALSLKPAMEKDLWVTLTYFVVAFSILVQGLTVGKLARKFSSH